MATIIVSRQVVDEDNQLNWVLSEIEEEDLLEGEQPYVEPLRPPEY